MTQESSLITGTTTTDTGTTASAADTSATTAATSTASADTSAAVGQTTTAAADVKTGETGTTDAQADAAKADAPKGAPEKYEFKAPEGKTFTPELLEAYEATARELNMPQEAAQKMLETVSTKLADVQKSAIEQVQNDWTQASKTDKEFGGDKLSENIAVAKKALDTFGTPELVKMLNETGLGNNPEIIRAFYRAGKAISEDRFVPAGQGKGPAGGRDAASVLYPNQSKT